MDEQIVADFAEAARWVESLVQRIDDWGAPGVGDWTMRALVGHTSRSLLTVEAYIDAPADKITVESPEAYYSIVAAQTGTDQHAVFERGVASGEALGGDPAFALSEIVERCIPLVEAAPDRAITKAAGGMMLSTYLPTRTFELVVHGLDIAAAAGITTSAPEGPLTGALTLAARLAILHGHGQRLLLTLTGRTELGSGFSVLE